MTETLQSQVCTHTRLCTRKVMCIEMVELVCEDNEVIIVFLFNLQIKPFNIIQPAPAEPFSVGSGSGHCPQSCLARGRQLIHSQTRDHPLCVQVRPRPATHVSGVTQKSTIRGFCIRPAKGGKTTRVPIKESQKCRGPPSPSPKTVQPCEGAVELVVPL